MDALQSNEHFKKYLEVMTIFQDIVSAVGQSQVTLMPNEVRIRAVFMNSRIYDDEPFAQLLAQDLRLYKNFKGDVPCFARYFLDHGTFKKEPAYEEMLKAMLKSHFGIYEIIDRDDTNGIVTFKDAITKEIYPVTDEKLSPVEGVRLFLFARLITVSGITFPSGYCLPFNHSKLLNKWIREHRIMFNEHDDAQLAADAYALYKRCGIPVRGVNG